jgi:hypothetical protein
MLRLRHGFPAVPWRPLPVRRCEAERGTDGIPFWVWRQYRGVKVRNSVVSTAQGVSLRCLLWGEPGWGKPGFSACRFGFGDSTRGAKVRNSVVSTAQGVSLRCLLWGEPGWGKPGFSACRFGFGDSTRGAKVRNSVVSTAQGASVRCLLWGEPCWGKPVCLRAVSVPERVPKS